MRKTHLLRNEASRPSESHSLLKTQTKWNTRTLVETALFIAILLLMYLTGFTRIPLGPLKMTLSMIPIAIGAMLLGPEIGALLGTVYGITSLYEAITGASPMTHAFFEVSPLHTIVLCVLLRAIVGYSTGVLFRIFFSVDKKQKACYYLGGLAAPVLNTILFMGYIVLVFYHTEFTQQLALAKHATGPFTFIILVAGAQGLFEAVMGCVIGGTVTKSVSKAKKRD